MLSKEERDEDQNNWFNPKIDCFQDFLSETEMWLNYQVDQNPVERDIGTQLESTVVPEDSISVVSKNK